MRAWFLLGEQGSDTDALGCLLRQWASRPENGHWSVETLRWASESATQAQTQPPDVLLSAEVSRLSCPWLADLLSRGVGLVVATPPERAGAILPLAAEHAVQLTPLPANVDSIGLAILGVLAAVQRQRSYQARIDQLQQRLNDRILIERAKGILVERLSISEKEAYQRLRLQSRRQRRPIREIAQCLLDAQTLFGPEINGLVEPSQRLHETASDPSREETR